MATTEPLPLVPATLITSMSRRTSSRRQTSWTRSRPSLICAAGGRGSRRASQSASGDDSGFGLWLKAASDGGFGRLWRLVVVEQFTFMDRIMAARSHEHGQQAMDAVAQFAAVDDLVDF